jgi:hypothetical protein
MQERLYFRRQFLLTHRIIKELHNWQHRQVAGVHLFAHPDLEITEAESSSAVVVLLGYIFDPAQPTSSNEDILSELISQIRRFEDLIFALKPFAGRYALIYRDNNRLDILHDPLALREIYYCTRSNKVICGSQPNLLDAFSEPKLGITQSQDIIYFYKNDMRQVRSGRLWVGDETYYHNVKKLMPNCYLDIGSLRTKRYWPNRKLEIMDVETAVRLSCNYLKGVLKAVTSRYETMMAVTSGTDSRSLLAASKEVSDRIYYFINKEPPLNDKSADILIPKRIFNKLNIPFHVHDVNGPVDKEFREIFLNNVFLSTDLILPTIYNVYYKNHTDKINLLGVGEIGRDYYGEAPNDLDGYYLARCLKYRSSKYAIEQCEKWLRKVKDTAEEYNVDIMRLFLWEGLLANWGVVGNSESDIAIEEFDPYNSHYIYEILLSVDKRYKKTGIFEAMLKEMWPEVLDFPFNPPDTKSDLIKNWLRRIGIFQHLKMQRYKFDRWRFRRIKE